MLSICVACTVKNIRISCGEFLYILSELLGSGWALASLFWPFTDTNVYWTGFINIWYSPQNICGYMDIFYSVCHTALHWARLMAQSLMSNIVCCFASLHNTSYISVLATAQVTVICFIVTGHLTVEHNELSTTRVSTYTFYDMIKSYKCTTTVHLEKYCLAMAFFNWSETGEIISYYSLTR